jgi:ankyrin repeat protein
VEVDEPERNPLFSAVNYGSLNIVKLLIERGVDPSICYTGESMKNMDALAFAVELGKKDIAEYLRSLK